MQILLRIEFSTSELRKHRDAARALAVKAAQQKASDLAAQNAGSAGDGIGAEGTVALGKISVTAAVSMTFQLQP